MLITRDMTQAQKTEAGAAVYRKIRSITRSGAILGGFPRDIYFDKVPKDIDLFIPIFRFPTEAQRMSIARRLFDALGQTFRAITEDEAMNQYGNVSPDRVFYVYECVENVSGRYQPLNIIFTQRRDAIENVHDFDFCFCQAVMQDTPTMLGWTPSLDRMRYVGRRLEDPQEIAKCVDHYRRLKRKYPELRINFDTRNLAHHIPLYTAFFEGGFIEAPRQILPAQGQNSSGDEVRLDTGAGARPQTIGDTDAWNAVQRAILEEEQRRVLRNHWGQVFAQQWTR